jgi:hypothetical protein
LPEDVVLGHVRAFESGEADTIRIAEPTLVATPERVRDFENPYDSVSDFDNPHDTVSDFEDPLQHGKLMDFPVDDVVPPAERGAVTLGLGVFPEGPDARILSSNWDSDGVWVPPRGTAN